MSFAETARIKTLEEKLIALESRISYIESTLSAGVPDLQAKSEGARKVALCPKCGVKPAYHFHVKHCRGTS